MAAYFFNITEEERINILDKHKHLYDGYVTNYGTNKEQPLYVQDFANDKQGLTVNNKGEVKKYTNMGINESMDLPLDMIGDGEDDLEHGTFDDDDSDIMLISPEHDEEEPEFEDMDMEDILGLSNDDEEDEVISSLQEQVNKSLDMFRRFKNL